MGREEKRRWGDLVDLKVLLIEDALETRNLIKSELIKFGIKNVCSAENGSKLLRMNKPLEVDLVLLGFGLGNCHSGIELIKAFELAELLPVWCKVIFITNADVVASSSHTCRYLKCEILPKPINPRLLLQSIEEGYSSQRWYRSILCDFYNNRLGALFIALEKVPLGLLSATQLDELGVIHAHILLRLGMGSEAWQRTNRIKDEVCRATNKLALASALGDERKLKLTLGMLKGNTLMHKRGLMYQIYLAVKESKYNSALECLESLAKHQFSLVEIELQALLQTKALGLIAANTFLKFKFGTSLENLFFRNSIKMIMLKCNLYLLFAESSSVSPPEAATKDAMLILESTPWHRSSFDFSPRLAYIRCAMILLNDPMAEQRDEYQRLQGILLTHDFFSLLLMSFIAYALKEEEQARDYLLQANEMILSLEVSPEILIGQMWFKRMFDTLYPISARAKEYNSIGIHHTQQNKPFPALQMFYQSHLCAPKHASIAINLLDAFSKLGLRRYWHIEAAQLAATIAEMSLKENEQRKYVQVLAKMQKLQSTEAQLVL